MPLDSTVLRTAFELGHIRTEAERTTKDEVINDLILLSFPVIWSWSFETLLLSLADCHYPLVRRMNEAGGVGCRISVQAYGGGA